GMRDAQTKQRETDCLFSINVLYVADIATLFQAGQQTYGNLAAIEHDAGTTAGSVFSKLPTTPTSAADFDWSLAAGVAPRTGGHTTFTGDLQTRASGFVTPTAFRGAADPAGAKWWQGWTEYSSN